MNERVQTGCTTHPLLSNQINLFIYLFKDTIKDFERNFADMVINFVEQVQGLYPSNECIYLPIYCYIAETLESCLQASFVEDNLCRWQYVRLKCS